MFELRIETAIDALLLLEQSWPTRAVSLVGDDLRFDLPTFGPHQPIVRFHDVEREGDGWVAPSKSQIDAVLAHTSDLTSVDRFLVHCHAGKSRSPAIAIGILIRNGVAPREAFARVKALRPLLIPNRLMIQQLDDILGVEGELVAIVVEHYALLPPKVSLPDRGG